MKTNVFVIICIICISGSLLYGQMYISGRVTDNNNQKELEGVNIFIPDLQRGAVTDQNGEYRINDIPKGNFSIQFSYIGYKTVIKKIKINDKNLRLNIKLEPTEVEIGQVVVVGNTVTSKAKLPYKIETLTSSQLQSLPQPTLVDALATLPGVSILSNGDGIAKPVIRGMFGYRIATILDGIRFDNQEWQNEHGFGLDDIGIGSIQVIEGPAALLYGADAVGGVVNLMHEKNAPVGKTLGNYNLKIFSNTLGANSQIGLRGASKKWSWQIHLGGESQADYLDGRGVKIPNTRFAGITAKAIAGYNSSWSVSNLEYIFSHHIYGVVEQSELNSPKEKQEDHFERGFEGPHHTIDYHILSFRNMLFKENSKFKLNIDFQNNHRTEQEGLDDPNAVKDLGELDIVLNTFSYNGQWIYSFSQNTELTLGTEGRFQKNKNDGKRILVPDAKMSELSAFSYFKTAYNAVELDGGIRYDVQKISTNEMGIKDSISYMPATDVSYNTLNGAVGVSFDLSENFIFKLNFASGYRAPNLAELMSNGVHEGTTRYELGNSNMKSEKNFQGDLGLTYQTSNIKIRGSFFHNSVNDYIYLQPTSEYIKNFRVYRFMQSDAALQGGEVSLDIQLTGWLNLKSSFSTVVGKKSDKSYLPFMPADNIISTVKTLLPAWFVFNNNYFQFSVKNYLNQNRTAYGETATPGYTLVDLGLGGNLNFGRHIIELSLSVTNLFDEVYFNHLSLLKPLGVYNMGRNFVFTANYPFFLN